VKVVMVGTGGGAIVASNTLRLMGTEAEIDLFTTRERVAYTPCEFPYVFRRALSSFEDIFYVGVNWFEKKGLKLHLKTEVTQIHAKEKYVIAGGEKYTYDKAVINTGSVSFMPPIAGLDGEREYYLNTDISEARILEEAIPKYKSAIIVGAGPIGLELAESFQLRGFEEVYVVEVLNNILPRALDPEMAEILHAPMESAGIKLFTGTQVKSVKREGDKKVAILPEGEIRADFLLVSTGVKPHVSLAQEAGLEIGAAGGIVVNKYLQSSDPDIYAVGDCVEGWDMMTGRKTLCPLATFTNRTGRIVGRNIAFGNTIPFIGTVLPFSGQLFGKCVATVGYTESYSRKLGWDIESVVHRGVTHKKKLGGVVMSVKLVLEKETQCLLGAQIIGDNTVGRIVDKLVIAIGEKIPISKLSQYETVYSPTLNNSYDALVNAMDVLIGKLVSQGEALR
jgi:NADPH-dependent 2,4-dienoyl-CoA reductase/sulfur reductase-like enzyme